MARSSFGQNRAASWKVAQRSRPMPHIVRLGRPANDNHRRRRWLRAFILLGLAAVLLVFLVIGPA